MRRLAVSLTIATLTAAFGCDSTPSKRDASAGGQRVAEVAVRLDAPSGGTPSASVLAYRAGVTGVAVDDVLSVIDPLVAAPPEAGCVRRDVAVSARTIGLHGGKIELEALGALSLDLGAGTPALRPLSRVYPELASAVGGVVSEAGPVELGFSPQTLGLTDESSGRRLAVTVPALPRLLDDDGVALPGQVVFDPGADLVLGVAGPARTGASSGTFVELRPFGATWALSCAVSASGAGFNGDNYVVVPAAELGRLAELRVPVSLEAVVRESHGLVLGSSPVRLTLEVRTSSVIELRP
jgi:hypothetical protein